MAFKFEKLKVWQRSVDLSGEIYDLTESIPKKDLFSLTSQIQRASDSIALNIAEESTGQTNPEVRRFLSFVLRSAIEVVSFLYLAKRRKFINDDQFEYFYNFLNRINKGIQALRKSLL